VTKMSDPEDSITDSITDIPADYKLEPESDAFLSEDGTVKVKIRFWPKDCGSKSVDKPKIAVGLVLPIWLFREVREGEVYTFYMPRDFKKLSPTEAREPEPDEP